MKATIWHNPKCGTSRNTLAALKEAGADVEVVEYLKTPPDAAKLKQLIADSGLSPQEMVRTRGTDAEERGLTRDDAGLDEIVAAMETDPILINRPIVETEKGVRLCRPVDKVHEIL